MVWTPTFQRNPLRQQFLVFLSLTVLKFYFRLKEEQVSFIGSLKQILHFIIQSRNRKGNYHSLGESTEFKISSVYALSSFGPFSICVFVFLPIYGHCSDDHDSKTCQADFLCCFNCCPSNLNHHARFPTFHSPRDARAMLQKLIRSRKIFYCLEVLSDCNWSFTGNTTAVQQRIPRLPLLDDLTPERGVRQ
ncbi:hypothetical protein AVEN_165822-1 [Araneus ventricosus]|uniref:Uncharacterized protein n=1 Tax=Araneus ventricosus TaxID=182803 RepID=A0A4Y2ELT3_ARAVE|nr:hypothetical protein AVEN_165822-1 [Araneus ventricosus]